MSLSRPVLLIFAFVTLFVLVGCSPAPAIPTLVPTLDAQESMPRPQATATPPLPATWTPLPETSVGGIDNAAPTLAPENQQTYAIAPGDTLAEIAASFGVTLEALIDINNITDIDHIEVGEILIIPQP